MKRTILLLFVFFSFFSMGYAQTPSKKMMELKEICLTLRNNMGSEQVITHMTKCYEDFMTRNNFTSDFLPLKMTYISGEENIVKNGEGKHVIYIPQYFKALAEEKDGIFNKYEEILSEWERIIKDGARSAKGYIFRQENLILQKGTSLIFELTVPKGPFDIMAIAEPNAFLTMKIQNLTTDQYYIAEKDASAHRWFEFDSPTVLRVTIENASQKDASMALFCF